MRKKWILGIFILFGLFLVYVQSAIAVDFTPPEVTVLSPNGREVWKVGETRRIQWRASDDYLVTKVEIYLSQDNGITWSLLEVVDVPPYTPPGSVLHRSFEWRIPDIHSTSCLIRVDAYDTAENRGTDMSDRVFTIERVPDTISPVVRIISPNGGEVWKTLETKTILWEASDPLNAWETSDSIDRVKISILLTYEGRYGWGYIARNLPNTGSYRWLIYHWPEEDYPLENCIIRIDASDTAGNASRDTSNGTFTVEAGDLINPTVRVISPNGGEIWKVGERRTIRWSASDNVAVSKVNISYHRGYHRERIATNLTNTGSYSWVVPDIPSNHIKIYVEVYDPSENRASDESDREFTIEAFSVVDTERPWLRIISPSPDSVVKSGAGGFKLKVTATDDVGIRDFTIKVDGVVRDTVRAKTGTSITQILHPRVYGTKRYIINIVAADFSGKTASKFMGIYSDDTPPTISNIFPRPNAPGNVYETDLPNVSISAVIVDRGMAKVKEARLVDISRRIIINRQTRPYEGDRYRFYITLPEDTFCQYYIQAFDKVGNMSQSSIITIRRKKVLKLKERPIKLKPPIAPK